MIIIISAGTMNKLLLCLYFFSSRTTQQPTNQEVACPGYETDMDAGPSGLEECIDEYVEDDQARDCYGVSEQGFGFEVVAEFPVLPGHFG